MSKNPRTILHVDLCCNVATSNDRRSSADRMANHGTYCDQIYALREEYENEEGES